jgi:hypothetical protein
MTKRFGGILAAAALAALLAPTGAFADPDELMPCKIIIIKAPPAAGGNGLTKFVCKGTFALPSAGAAPTGDNLAVSVDTVPPGNYVFAPTNCTGLGNPAGAKGYKCSLDPLAPLLILKTNVVKGIVKEDVPLFFYGTNHPYSVDVAIRLVSVGVSDTKSYCARFPLVGALKNDPSQFKAKNAPAPTACSPSGAFLDSADGLL